MRLKYLQQLQDQTVKEGKTARFEVELTHENVPVVWYRNEVKLHVSRTVLIHVEGKRHTLEMRSLSLDDTCQVKAEAKGIYSMAKLTVVGKQNTPFFFFFPLPQLHLFHSALFLFLLISRFVVLNFVISYVFRINIHKKEKMLYFTALD